MFFFQIFEGRKGLILTFLGLHCIFLGPTISHFMGGRWRGQSRHSNLLTYASFWSWDNALEERICGLRSLVNFFLCRNFRAVGFLGVCIFY